MKENPKITVVTVAYNACACLEKTIKSVLGQTYSNMEYIVIDGGSTDDTKSMLETYKCKIDILVSEPDKGIYDAMNKGVKLSAGDYCIFMNAGDVFVSGSVVAEVVAAGMMADVIYGDILKNGKVKRSLTPRNCHKMYFCHQAVFTRVSCMKEYPFDISHKMSADFKQFKQLYLAGKSFFYNHILITDYDTNGVSNTKRSKGLWDNISVICEVDSFSEKLRLLPRLLFAYIMCRIRNK